MPSVQWHSKALNVCKAYAAATARSVAYPACGTTSPLCPCSNETESPRKATKAKGYDSVLRPSHVRLCCIVLSNVRFVFHNAHVCLTSNSWSRCRCFNFDFTNGLYTSGAIGLWRCRRWTVVLVGLRNI